MTEIAIAKINSFAPIAAQTDFAVSPSEEVVFILTSGQLQAIIKEAIQLLQDRIGSLEAFSCQSEGEDDRLGGHTRHPGQFLNSIQHDPNLFRLSAPWAVQGGRTIRNKQIL